MGTLSHDTATIDRFHTQESVRAWGEHDQQDDQVVTAGSFQKITCDGGEGSTLLPSGATGVWNTTTSAGTFISGGVYDFTIALTMTASANNTSVTMRLINTVDPLDFLEYELFVERSSVAKTYNGVFELISTGSAFEIELNPEAQVTVNRVRIFESRKY
jgi:hypothetical protein